jgi:hypothetical protein
MDASVQLWDVSRRMRRGPALRLHRNTGTGVREVTSVAYQDALGELAEGKPADAIQLGELASHYEGAAAEGEAVVVLARWRYLGSGYQTRGRLGFPARLPPMP